MSPCGLHYEVQSLNSTHHDNDTDTSDSVHYSTNTMFWLHHWISLELIRNTLCIMYFKTCVSNLYYKKLWLLMYAQLNQPVWWKCVCVCVCVCVYVCVMEGGGGISDKLPIPIINLLFLMFVFAWLWSVQSVWVQTSMCRKLPLFETCVKSLNVLVPCLLLFSIFVCLLSKPKTELRKGILISQ